MQTLLSSPTNHFHSDVKFAPDGGLEAARFLIQSQNVPDAAAEEDFVSQLRNVVKRYPHLNPTVFHPYFIFFDQVRNL